ncbi:hypothetical protein ALC53_06227 [Atta colombica]|uniref:Gustatory receptor n=1 Tax=Atta colombica TaxID=520822 RepID=A0A151I3H0_9HYME|nr:hypothetical protein ALC53_06227 [Atta colombica]
MRSWGEVRRSYNHVKNIFNTTFRNGIVFVFQNQLSKELRRFEGTYPYKIRLVHELNENDFNRCVKFCEGMIGKKTTVLISQLLSISCDKESRKQLEIFSLQLLHRPLEFSACGLFTLDRTLVTSLIDEKWIYFQNPKRKKSWFIPPNHQYFLKNRFGRKTMLCLEHYLDLTHIMLSLDICVENERGESTSVASDSRGNRINHLLHSMFNQIDIYFNKTFHLISLLFMERRYLQDMDTLDSSNPNTALKRRAQYSDKICMLDASLFVKRAKISLCAIRTLKCCIKRHLITKSSKIFTRLNSLLHISYLSCAMTYIDPCMKENSLLFLDVLKFVNYRKLCIGTRSIMPPFVKTKKYIPVYSDSAIQFCEINLDEDNRERNFEQIVIMQSIVEYIDTLVQDDYSVKRMKCQIHVWFTSLFNCNEQFPKSVRSSIDDVTRMISQIFLNLRSKKWIHDKQSRITIYNLFYFVDSQIYY